jgi:hypothetical protein
MVEETGVPGGNHRYVIRAENPFKRCNLYLVPRAGIQPTLCTDWIDEQAYFGPQNGIVRVDVLRIKK